MNTERLPDFLLLGAQKAGSTWFTRNIRAHPDVVMPLKELQYFIKNYGLGESWYSAHFANAADHQIVGEGTPGYLYVESAAERIYDTLGSEVRLIASLRNPVDRAYSAFWNLVGGGVITVDADFGEEFEKDTDGIRTRGLYSSQIHRFIEMFGEDNLYTAVLEVDLGDNAPATLSAVYEHIGVDPTFTPSTASTRANVGGSPRKGGATFSRFGAAVSRASDRLPQPVEKAMRRVYAEAFNRLPPTREFTPLPPESKSEYLDFYRDDIAILSDTIGRDLGIWRQAAT